MYNTVKAIDPAILIEEVKKRPFLYDNRASIMNVETRKSAWFEIATKLINNFTEMTSIEKDNISRDIQSKWKGIRDSYRRTLRLEEEDRRLGVHPPRKTRYYYFDLLDFLAEYCTSKRYPKRNCELQNSESSPRDSRETTENLITNNDSSGFLPQDYLSIKTEIDYENGVEVDSEENYEDTTTFSDEPVKKKMKCFCTENESGNNNSNANANLVKILEELCDIRREDQLSDKKGNRSFVLSLLPFMEKLSNEENLNVRVEFMSILQNYNRRKD